MNSPTFFLRFVTRVLPHIPMLRHEHSRFIAFRSSCGNGSFSRSIVSSLFSLISTFAKLPSVMLGCEIVRSPACLSVRLLSHLRIPLLHSEDNTRKTITERLWPQGFSDSAGNGWVSSGSNQFCRKCERAVGRLHNNSTRYAAPLCAAEGTATWRGVCTGQHSASHMSGLR
jgi:hypothetical protein